MRAFTSFTQTRDRETSTASLFCGTKLAFFVWLTSVSVSVSTWLINVKTMSKRARMDKYMHQGSCNYGAIKGMSGTSSNTSRQWYQLVLLTWMKILLHVTTLNKDICINKQSVFKMWLKKETKNYLLMIYMAWGVSVWVKIQ